MKKYYLSHPYTGNEAKNIVSARRKKVQFQQHCKDALVINPLDFFLDIDEVLNHAEIMKKALYLLRDCDAMILCDGWQESKGCREEYAYAMENGIRVLPFSEWDMKICP